MRHHISNIMIQCSGISSVCLTTVLVEAAAVKVQIFLLEVQLAGLLGRETRGYMARSAAALTYSTVRRCASVCYRRRGNGVEVGHCGTAYLGRNLQCIALTVLSCQLEVYAGAARRSTHRVRIRGGRRSGEV